MLDRLLNTPQAANVLGVSRTFLERDRWIANQGSTPPKIPYVRIGPKTIRYRMCDLMDVIDKSLQS